MTVLGFPCNQFGRQEPGTNAEILEFATSRYNANFPMFEKIEVNGPGACELYRYLKSGKAGPKGSKIAWNFTKFLVDGDGEVVARYEPRTRPEDIAKAVRAIADGALDYAAGQVLDVDGGFHLRTL